MICEHMYVCRSTGEIKSDLECDFYDWLSRRQICKNGEYRLKNDPFVHLINEHPQRDLTQLYSLPYPLDVQSNTKKIKKIAWPCCIVYEENDELRSDYIKEIIEKCLVALKKMDADVELICFDNEVLDVSYFAPASIVKYVETVRTSEERNVKRALEHAEDEIRKRCVCYETCGVEYSSPLIVLITAGNFVDAIEKTEYDNKILSFALPGRSYESLQDVSEIVAIESDFIELFEDINKRQKVLTRWFGGFYGKEYYGKLVYEGIRFDTFSIKNESCNMIRVFKDKYKYLADKIKAMLTIDNGEYMKESDWPSDLVYYEGKIVGYLVNTAIPENRTCSLYEFMRNNDSLKDKLNVAIQICEFVEKLHRKNVVIGNFEPGEILVDEKLKVFWKDAWRWHVLTAEKEYGCETYHGEYIAKEVLEKPRSEGLILTLTKESDLFSLAIIMFELLMGVHPFACSIDFSTLDKNEEDVRLPCISDNVRKGFSPFFQKMRGVKIPANCPDYSYLPTEVGRLFDSVFVYGYDNPMLRATPREWTDVLGDFCNEIIICNNNAKHEYPAYLDKCPWCELDNKLKRIRENDWSKEVSGISDDRAVMPNNLTYSMDKHAKPKKRGLIGKIGDVICEQE